MNKLTHNERMRATARRLPDEAHYPVTWPSNAGDWDEPDIAADLYDAYMNEVEN